MYIIIYGTNAEPCMGIETCSSTSVHDFWVTVVVLQLSEDVVGVFTAEVAETGLDPHHLPGEPGAVRTLEVHVDRLGLVGDAAALVRADPAVFGPVLLLAGAAGDREVGGLIFPVDVEAFLSRLKEETERDKARGCLRRSLF